MEWEVPRELAAAHVRYSGEAGRAWIDRLPRLAAEIVDRWGLRVDGPPVHGAVALVRPVRLPDGTAAVLKLQPVDEETAGEPAALRAWNGAGAVRLLRCDTASGSMLLERLDAARTLGGIPDDMAALRELSHLLSRLTAVATPPGIRRLADVAAAMLDRLPSTLDRMAPDDRALARECAAALAEVLPESGDRLLHWDLHYDNVLARPGGEPAPPGGEFGYRDGLLADPHRELAFPSGGWVAIDPKPLAGDPGFDLLPALHNRWDDVVASGDVVRAVRRRYDLMTDVVGLDRERARAWTLGRVLQELLWDPEGTDWLVGPDRVIARALLDR